MAPAFASGVVYFLWVGIFNVMVIAQFWALAADLFTPEQGKRLFPLIGVGSSLGALAGAVRAGEVMESMGPMRLLMGGGATLVLCAVLSVIASRRHAPASARRRPRRRTSRSARQGGFALIFQDRYLMLIAALTVLLNVVNTSGEYLFGRYVVEQANVVYGAGAGGGRGAPDLCRQRLQPAVQHRQPARASSSSCSSYRASSSSWASASRCSCIRSSRSPATR